MGQESRLCEATEAGESQQSPVTKVWRKARPIARRLSLGTGTGPDFCTWASAKLSAAHIDPGAPRIRAPLARWQPLRCILRQDRSAATQIPLPAARAHTLPPSTCRPRLLDARARTQYCRPGWVWRCSDGVLDFNLRPDECSFRHRPRSDRQGLREGDNA